MTYPIGTFLTYSISGELIKVSSIITSWAFPTYQVQKGGLKRIC